MLINKINCPFGCKNAMFAESTRVVSSPNSKLLLDSQRSNPSNNQTVKSYKCLCCGNIFETHEKTSNNGRIIL